MKFIVGRDDANLVLYKDPREGDSYLFKEVFQPYMKLVNKNLVANLLEALNFNKRHFNVDPIPILHRDYHLYHFP